MKKPICLMIAAIMIASCVAAVSAAKSGFSDVEEGRWSEASIKYAVDNGYMKGVGGDRFDPEGLLTRAMVVTVLWRREDSPAPTAPSGFNDVPSGEWYADAVAWARETGVVLGVTDTTFDPNGLITREQLATMLFRFSSSAPVSVPERADLEPFSDDEKVSDWAQEPLEWAVQAGLINGTDGGRLDPGGFATREQFAAIVERYDGSFTLQYNEPVPISHYTEKEYPLVDNADYYVSTAGSDAGDGSFDHPFATFNKAVEAVRELKKTRTDDITVAFMAGDYGPLSVSLTAEDAGSPTQRITYCKYGDGDVVFDNGADLSAGVFSDIGESEYFMFPERARSHIKKADVSGLVAGDPDELIIFTESGVLDQARYPNKYPDGTDQLLHQAARAASRHSYELTSNLLQKRINKYHTLEGMKVYGYIVRGYQKHLIKVASYDEDTHIIELLNPEAGEYYGGINPEKDDCDMAFINLSEELDANGEYWLDTSTMTLYVYEPHGDYRFPMHGTMITMRNADFITFRGLTMRNTSERFIDETGGRAITVERCRFNCALNSSNQGTQSDNYNAGLYFADHPTEVSKDLVFTDNVFDCFYGAALKVDGKCEGGQRFDRTTNILFDNNLVRKTNLVFDFRCGVDLSSCSKVEVSHNRFEECSRGAVSFSRSYDVTVEYNDFASVMLNSTDGGILYADWSCDGRNVVVRHNCFGPVTTAGIGTFGFYIDDNTCGAEVCSNIFWNTGNSAAMIHDGRDCFIHDNVVIATDKGAYGGEGLGFGVSSTRVEIEEYIADGTIDQMRTEEWSIVRGEGIWNEMFELCDTYDNYKNAILSRWPQILDYHLDYMNTDDPDFVFNSVNTFARNVYFNDSGKKCDFSDNVLILKYLTVGEERGFTLDENLFFVNPALGDYRVRKGADIPDLEFEKIGRY